MNQEIKNRLSAIKYTLNHKLAILKLWHKYNTRVSLLRVILHDLDKVILYLLIGVENTSKFHNKYIGHHNIKNNEDFYEKYLDCASARYTKKDKPLDALETFKKYYPNMYEVAKKHYDVVEFK